MSQIRSQFASAARRPRLLAWLAPMHSDHPRVRGRRVMLMIAFLWMANILDLSLTLLAIELGDFHEANPVARTLVSRPNLLVSFKLALVAAATLVLFLLRRRRTTELACFALCGVYAGLGFIWLFYYLPV